MKLGLECGFMAAELHGARYFKKYLKVSNKILEDLYVFCMDL